MSLATHGFRFVKRTDGTFTWVHKNEMLSSDTDCTDMTDAQFEATVRAASCQA